MGRCGADKPIYEPPSDDEPLDEIELALVRALVPIIAKKILAEALMPEIPKAGSASPLAMPTLKHQRDAV